MRIGVRMSDSSAGGTSKTGFLEYSKSWKDALQVFFVCNTIWVLNITKNVTEMPIFGTRQVGGV